MQSDKQRAWALDQLQKSIFFHQRLHEWQLLEVAEQIEGISGESLAWDLPQLNISEMAWNRVIHSGIKPIIVFAHPSVLTNVNRSVGYYRMLSMVSQKSMGQIGLASTHYEQTEKLPSSEAAERIARRLNTLICTLIEQEQAIEAREFDLWRGMAAGSQAQGSWQNRKGDLIEEIMRRDLLSQLHRVDLIEGDNPVDISTRAVDLNLVDGRVVRMGSEPDIEVFTKGRIQAAVEVKGGIDPAGVLERVGAAIKSLRRSKENSAGAVTILVMTAVSLSAQARSDIESNRLSVNYLFTVEDILHDAERKAEYYSILGLNSLEFE
ncbi:MAG: XcyI family restriction endonuclease [Chloroflexi bacterium]|nr:XcyI family restriction endonuclease [Chloroflexota bacterium]